MNLDDVYRIALPRKKKKRIGRGTASKGKTSGRGHKGAKSRSGWGGLGFYEGGQMPLFRRLPRKGFTNARYKTVYAVVNLHQLNRFEDGQTVDRAALEAQGLINGQDELIKILGTGDLEKKLIVVADKFSKSARVKIEAKGGETQQPENG